MFTSAAKTLLTADLFRYVSYARFDRGGVMTRSVIERKFYDENGDIMVEFKLGDTPDADTRVTRVQLCTEDGTVLDETRVNITMSAGRSTPVYSYTLTLRPLLENEKIITE